MGDVSKPRDLEDRTFLFAESVRGFVKQLRTLSGEHRLPACCFRQLAGELFERLGPKIFCDALVSSASCRRLQASSLRSPELGNWDLELPNGEK